MWLFNRNGASGFSSSSTAEEVTHGIDGSGLTAIVTGASSGIGAETSRVLALRGVHVIMAVRNIAAAEDVKETIVKEIPAAKVDIMELDLSSLASVRKFAADFISSGHSLNMLINNAGVSGIPFILSKDNIELQFATNHLGHFLLTNLLLDKMKETTRKTKREGRIVNVSSGAYCVFTYREGIRFDKINDPESYGRFTAYGQSKLANILHTCELTRRLKEGGVEITANSIHPGTVATNVFRNLGVFDGLVSTFGKFFFKTVQQGASTTCYVALHPQLKGISGEFFMGNNLATRTAIARDMDLAKRLWDFSMDLVKLPRPDTHVTTDLVGTLGCIPPEYSQTLTATFRGDVYSLGIVLLELLTVKCPMEVCREKSCRDLVSWIFQLKSENKMEEIFDTSI
ncbi:Short-chain dehydrogenase TIC 32, chloroplastic [Capsicum baccatum]|uniref:Short-chain dehydrogenase TIC 32, chloroplastic n=1 Tax=Capsicum baccatum TaxID=33114 RepID=A0A2G2X6Q4_CAPBA|nr:Short-chain dehydrogenase TIC 32, chloroplastic [Capsicum baccatum]